MTLVLEIGHELRSIKKPLSFTATRRTSSAAKLWLVSGALTSKLEHVESHLVSPAVGRTRAGRGGWAVLRVQLPPADFTFVNESEVASVDPALITGVPEGRICSAIFEGLTRNRSDNLEPEPGTADVVGDFRRSTDLHVSHPSGRTVVQRRAGHRARFSVFPAPAARSAHRFAVRLPSVVHQERETLHHGRQRTSTAGDPVEVELNPPADVPNTVRGKLLFGTLVEDRSTKHEYPRPGVSLCRIDGKERQLPGGRYGTSLPDGIEACRQVLLDFREVGHPRGRRPHSENRAR